MPTMKSKKKTSESFETSIAELRTRYDQLNEQKIKIQTQCETVKERLDELKRSALEQFGTDDVQQLKKQLDKLNKENESKRVKYEKDLNAITDALNQIDENLENDEDLS